jgi:putative ABC transport system ATP-binding protein
VNSVEQATARHVVLRTDHLGRVVDGVAIVNDVSMEVLRGELLGIVGASGSGKSSLLRLLNRLDEPTSGTVYLEGVDYKAIAPRELRRRLGMVTQRPFLFPGTVASNLQFGPQQRGEVLPDEAVHGLLRQVGMDGFAERDVANLSGGEQQRVSVARALANQPEMLLLDEPTSALDEDAKLGVEQLIRELATATSRTFILVTHDREQARRICDRVGTMERGRLIHMGTPQEVLRA